MNRRWWVLIAGGVVAAAVGIAMAGREVREVVGALTVEIPRARLALPAVVRPAPAVGFAVGCWRAVPRSLGAQQAGVFQMENLPLSWTRVGPRVVAKATIRIAGSGELLFDLPLGLPVDRLTSFWGVAWPTDTSACEAGVRLVSRTEVLVWWSCDPSPPRQMTLHVGYDAVVSEIPPWMKEPRLSLTVCGD